VRILCFDDFDGGGLLSLCEQCKRKVKILTGKSNHTSTQRSFELKIIWTLVVVMIGVERWKKFWRLCFGAESQVVCEWRVVGTEENSMRVRCSLK
jgi:hypothetical protein